MNDIFWIDLFCGAGGVSLGIHKAGQKVLACINHDKNAILSHQANHPETLHYTEDIRTIELSPIIEVVKRVRAENKNAKICLWASLECTHFSNAKGGGSRDADSRTLAEHLFRYLEAIFFDYIYIENVEEFMSWGPLCAKMEKIKTAYGNVDVCPIKFDKKTKSMQPIWKPESKTKGRDYIKWVNAICKYGYNHNYKIMNCADYGDPTKRFRYFGIFAKEGLKIHFPNPTHSDPKRIRKVENMQQDLFSSHTLYPWRAVRECLELDNTGQSIFSRKKGLVEKSLRRIYAGLIKYVMDNDKEVEAFIENIYSDCTNYFEEADALLIPLLNNEKDSIKPFITKYNSNSPTTGISVPQDIDNPSSTVCTHGRLGIVQAFLAGYYSSPNIKAEKGKLNSIDNPSPSITTIPHESIVFIKKYDTAFISSFHGGENQHNRNYSVENPHLTVTTNNKEALVFIAKYYGQENQSVNSSSIEDPSPTLTTLDRLSMISCHHYLINPQYNNTVSSIDKPCFTIIARMDKAPIYLANTERMENDKNLIACMEVNKEDSPYMIRIKLCMALYGLADIKMRMLTIPELKQIQSFPKNYVLIGTQAEQKKYIGNAVPSNTVMNLVKCLAI